MLPTLTPAEFYDRYAAIIYGSICRVITDKAVAEKIFTEVFMIELCKQPTDVKEKMLFTAKLLRRVHQFTIEALTHYGITNENLYAKQHESVLDLFCSKHTSVAATSSHLNLSEADVKKILHTDLLKFRVKKDSSLVNSTEICSSN